ncbi:MAG: hypothetical protein ACM3XM_05350 [Mycobacterium leprae]
MNAYINAFWIPELNQFAADSSKNGPQVFWKQALMLEVLLRPDYARLDADEHDAAA